MENSLLPSMQMFRGDTSTCNSVSDTESRQLMQKCLEQIEALLVSMQTENTLMTQTMMVITSCITGDNMYESNPLTPIKDQQRQVESIMPSKPTWKSTIKR